jgi:hypothetical protein
VSGARNVLGPELKALTTNSFEYIISEVSHALIEASPALFGDSRVEVLGTFPTHVLARVDEHRCVRIDLKVSEDGYVVEKVEDLGNSFADAKARAESAAEAFLRGRDQRVEEELRQLCSMGEVTEYRSPRQLIAEAKDCLTAPRPWKKLLEAEAPKIANVSGFQIPEKVAPKFRKLWDGSIAESDLQAYGDLVRSDLRSACFRMKGLQENLSKSRSLLEPLVAQATDQSQKVLASVGFFAEDLSKDVSHQCCALQEIEQGVSDVRALSEVHDVLVTELPRFEAAGTFVQKVVSSLSEASR